MVVRFVVLFLMAVLLTPSSFAVAQEVKQGEKEEAVWRPNETRETIYKNPFLRGLMDSGVKLIPLGKEGVFDSWLMTSGGQLQVFYTVPGSDLVFSGFVIGPEGDNKTAQQIARYEALNDGVVSKEIEKGLFEKKNLSSLSPAEQLSYKIKETKGFVFAENKGKPFVFVFLTPDCARCVDYYVTLKELYHDRGLVNIQFVPVAKTQTQKDLFVSLFFLENAQEKLFRFLDDPKVASDVDLKDERYNNILNYNTALLREYKLDNSLPVTFYLNHAGKLQIVQDVPLDLNAMIKDVGSLD